MKRREHEDADAEEHADAEDEPEETHRDACVPLAEDLEQLRGESLCATGLLEYRAEYGAEAVM